jgi:hypothetical protein
MPVDLHLPTNEQGFYDLDDEMDSFVDMLFDHYREVRENRVSGKDREVRENRVSGKDREAQEPKAEPIKIDVSNVKPLSEEEQEEYLEILLGYESDDEEN